MTTSTTDQHPLQSIGENAAHTAKGLFRMGSLYATFHVSLIVVPMLLSLVMLGFSSLHDVAIRAFSIVVLLSSFLLLVTQKQFQSIRPYHALANKFLQLHDEARDAYLADNLDEAARLSEALNKLREKTSSLPIRMLGQILAKRAIKKGEINISWTEPKD